MKYVNRIRKFGSVATANSYIYYYKGYHNLCGLIHYTDVDGFDFMLSDYSSSPRVQCNIKKEDFKFFSV